MKRKILAFLVFTLILCSCANGTDENVSGITETVSLTSTAAETVSAAEASETETETDVTEDSSPCYIYSGDEPCLKALAQICERFPCDTSLEYNFSDIDGDLREELLILAPHPENMDKCALYAVSQDGKYRVSPPLYSFEGNRFHSCAAYLGDGAEPCIAVASMEEKGYSCTAYYMPASLETVSEKEIKFFDRWSFPLENASREYVIQFLSAEGMTDDELSEKIISELSKTPLERAEEYFQSSSDSVLVDITGDGFPEMISVMLEGYVYDMSWSAYDMSGRYPIKFASGILDGGESIKLISDENGGRKLVSAYTTGIAVNFRCKEADICEISYPLQSRKRTLGCETYYYSRNSDTEKQTAYRTELYMNGREYEDRGKYFEFEFLPGEYYKETAFDKMYSDFLSEWDILLEIEIDENGEPYISGNELEKSTAFSEYPEVNNAPVGVGKAVRYIDVCGEMYPEDSREIAINAEAVDDDFDFSVLNSFPELRSLILSGDSESGRRIKFSPSEWCGKVTHLRVAPLLYEPEGGYGCFENVRDIVVLGRPDSIEFITDMKNIEVFTCEFAPDHEFLRPLMSLPKLAVIPDSGYGSFMPYEEIRNRPEEFIRWMKDNDIIWAMVKVG